MPNISQITLPSGSTYDIKDSWARSQIEAITGGSAVVFKGVSSTVLTDGGTENPTVSGSVVTSKSVGDLYFYDMSELIWGPDEKWHLLGDASIVGDLGDFAFANTGTTTYKPTGTVSQPIFSGTAATISASYTPAGSVSKPTFNGTAATISASYTPTGSVTVSSTGTTNKTATVNTTTGTATYTPGGTVSQPTFSGTPATLSTSLGTVDSASFSGTPATISISKSYTPGGTVGIPTISVDTAGTTTTVNSITDVGSLPDFDATVTSEVLTFSWSAGTLPTKGANTTVKTGDALYTSSRPSFTGTAATISASASYTPAGTVSVTKTNKDIEIEYEPAGTISQPNFSGTGVRLVTGNIAVPNAFGGTFSGTAATISTEYTPEGSVSQPIFSGTAATISSAYTPGGTVSQPTFNGTQATITVNPVN